MVNTHAQHPHQLFCRGPVFRARRRARHGQGQPFFRGELLAAHKQEAGDLPKGEDAGLGGDLQEEAWEQQGWRLERRAEVAILEECPEVLDEIWTRGKGHDRVHSAGRNAKPDSPMQVAVVSGRLDLRCPKAGGAEEG